MTDTQTITRLLGINCVLILSNIVIYSGHTSIGETSIVQLVEVGSSPTRVSMVKKVNGTYFFIHDMPGVYRRLAMAATENIAGPCDKYLMIEVSWKSETTYDVGNSFWTPANNIVKCDIFVES